jgi:DNA-binding NarL/FixJ family response regulator
MQPDLDEYPASPIRVLLVDDDPTYRDGLRQLLGITKDLIVVGEASSAEEAFVVGRQVRPHVVLIDAELPRAACVEMMRAFADPNDRPQQQPSFICLAVYPDQHDAAIQAGAARFLRKDGSPRELMEAIRTAARSRLDARRRADNGRRSEPGAQLA